MDSSLDVVRRVHDRYASLIPNLTTLGYFEDKLQAIVLPSVMRDDFERSFQTQDPVARVQVHPLLAHELRHWFDVVGTLWGQRRLVTFFNALNARIGNDPSRFAPIASYFRDTKKAFLIDYFTTVTDDPTVLASREPWQYALSCGNRFEADGTVSETRRLLFARFRTHDDRFVSRTPLSAASLLETGAMYAEIEADIAVLKTVPDKDRASFEEKHIRPRHGFLYDPRMTAYTVAAHLVSTQLNWDNARLTYALAASLGNVCLNLPSDLYKTLRPPRALEWIQDANDHLKEECDIGYAFMTLLFYAAEVIQESGDGDTPKDNELSRAGLPHIDDIEQSVEKQMLNMHEDIVDGPFASYLHSLLEYGLAVYQARGIRGTSLLPMQAIVEARFIPPIMLADHGPFTISEDDKIWQDCDARWAATWQVLEQMREFHSVCGV